MELRNNYANITDKIDAVFLPRHVGTLMKNKEIKAMQKIVSNTIASVVIWCSAPSME